MKPGQKEITPGTDVSLHIFFGTGGYFCSVLLSNFIWSTSLSAEWLSSLFLALHSCFRFIFLLKFFGFVFQSNFTFNFLFFGGVVVTQFEDDSISTIVISTFIIDFIDVVVNNIFFTIGVFDVNFQIINIFDVVVIDFTSLSVATASTERDAATSTRPTIDISIFLLLLSFMSEPLLSVCSVKTTG